ncbi:short-chain dehydrogenase TIC 32, chloroplastic [Selaginella moellendorffii]|uniref:short-chain dehydrogenase TIC 32, chloroplastic n=1 Tax=Selaginella moellendorffii TaxID=88036 RepID=UPI000D1C6E6E|nr:short-chain dehydrogenase TIC 32, chloroplastic [Selaginella moellendorffii]|eukprot:XP_024523713.1 short-chain dehydrogenase TIC 32, chloroplastic [Selaginella moellendorffii]
MTGIQRSTREGVGVGADGAGVVVFDESAIRAKGVDITANTVHPGFIMSPLMRHTFYIMRFLKFFSSFLWKNVPQDAATTCYTALHPSLKDVTGQYFVDSNKSSCSAYGRDPELAHKLWTFSQELIDKHSPS